MAEGTMKGLNDWSVEEFSGALGALLRNARKECMESAEFDVKDDKDLYKVVIKPIYK